MVEFVQIHELANCVDSGTELVDETASRIAQRENREGQVIKQWSREMSQVCIDNVPEVPMYHSSPCCGNYIY